MTNFKSYYPRAKEIAKQIFANPELGYKEFKTSELVVSELLRINPQVKIEKFSGTGIKVKLDLGYTKTLAFVAELDAVYQPGHEFADPESGAAHACGHFTQTTVALAMFNEITTTNILDSFAANLVFIFVPAEEYIDLDFRKELRAKGEIKYFGGKPEAMSNGVFDDVDFAVCIHAIGEEFAKRTVEINCDLAGFNFKYYNFLGKPSHAGFDPFAGVNAYSMSTLFNTAVGLSRQQVKDTEMIRFNPIVTNSDMSINVIPDHVEVATDVRYLNASYGKQILDRLDQAALGSAQALGGEVEITTEVGYLPFIQNREMNQLVYETYQETDAIEDIITDRGAIAAAGDIGDLSFMMPSIQISHGGFKGTIHGANFYLVDEEFVLQILPEFVLNSMVKISQNQDQINFYKRSFDEYKQQLQLMEDK